MSLTPEDIQQLEHIATCLDAQAAWQSEPPTTSDEETDEELANLVQEAEEAAEHTQADPRCRTMAGSCSQRWYRYASCFRILRELGRRRSPPKFVGWRRWRKIGAGSQNLLDGHIYIRH